MKGKDLAVLGGIGLAVYLLIPKGREAAAAGGITILPGAPAAAAGSDIGGIFSGIASLFGAMPQPIVPEINIPEFIMPPIIIPEVPGLPDFPDWSDFFPDWESFLPDLPDELKLPDIPGIPGIPGVDLSFFDIFEGVIDAPKRTIEEGVKGWVSFWDTTTNIIAWGNRPWYELFLDPLWLKKGEQEFIERGKAEWLAKGYPEEITPEWYYEQKRLNSGLLPHQIAAMRADTEPEAASRYPEYEADMALLAETAPYLLTEAELERYG